MAVFCRRILRKYARASSDEASSVSSTHNFWSNAGAMQERRGGKVKRPQCSDPTKIEEN
jgi:hypothetical protein